MTLLLRDVEAEDQAFLQQVYASTRADELAATGWNEAACTAFVTMQFEAQRRHYQAQFPDADHAVIEWHRGPQSTPVGRLWVDRRPHAIHILDIALLAPYRRLGLGTECLRRLQAEAVDRNLPLTIQVESFNPARRLYQRLGFVPTSEHGLHIAMAWRAPTVHIEEIEIEQA